MSSLDLETQNEELAVLSSILDDTVFEWKKISPSNPNNQGTLVVEVTLSEKFFIQSQSGNFDWRR